MGSQLANPTVNKNYADECAFSQNDFHDLLTRRGLRIENGFVWIRWVSIKETSVWNFGPGGN